MLDGDVAVTEETIEFGLRDLRVGDSEFSATGRLDRPSGALAASIVIPFLDAPAWLAARGESAEPAAGEVAETARRRLIPDTPLPLTLLDGPPLDVTIRTGPLGLRDPVHRSRTLVENVDLRLQRETGKLTLDVSEINGSRGTLALRVEAGRENDGAAIESTLSVRAMPLGIISAGGYESLPRHDLDSQLTARGSTLREIAATLDGELLLTGGRGTLPNTSVSLITESFFQQLLLSVLPALKDQQRDRQVECTVLAARVRRGLVEFDPGFIIRTERVDLSARGEVNLRDERVAIRFDNQARKGLGISAASIVNPYVQITGTLAKPAIGLDVAGSAIAGGAAVATGGLTVLAKPLYGRFLARKNPCEVALERWREGPA